MRIVDIGEASHRRVIGGSPARETPDLEQFESEFFDPGQHAVQRGLIRDAAQQRVLCPGLGVQGGERAQRRRAEVAADADLVTGRCGRRLVIGLRSPPA